MPQPGRAVEECILSIFTASTHSEASLWSPGYPLGYAPGPLFSRILNTVEDAQLEGSVATSDEALELVRALFPRE